MFQCGLRTSVEHSGEFVEAVVAGDFVDRGAGALPFDFLVHDEVALRERSAVGRQFAFSWKSSPADPVAIAAEIRYSSAMAAIAERLDQRLSQLPAQRVAVVERMIDELLTLAEPEGATVRVTDEVTKRERVLAALNRIASRGGIAGIEDPVAWQRDIRTGGLLPGRAS